MGSKILGNGEAQSGGQQDNLRELGSSLQARSTG